MSSNPSTPDDPGLFDDLPLHAKEPPKKAVHPPEPPRVETPPTKQAVEKDISDVRPSEELRMLFQEEPKEEATPPEPKLGPEKAESPPEKEIELEIEDADLTRARLVAGLLDLGVVLAVAVTAFVCVALMGVDLTPWPWVPTALFLIAFSFLYCVFPLAFWGRTPGMAYLGLQARSLDGKSLSFGQTGWRWLAGLLTVVSFGLPLILTLKGTYLSDLLSKSQVEIVGR